MSRLTVRIQSSDDRTVVAAKNDTVIMQSASQSIDQFKCQRIVSTDAANDQCSISVIARRCDLKRSLTSALSRSFPGEWLRRIDENTRRSFRSGFYCFRSHRLLHHRGCRSRRILCRLIQGHTSRLVDWLGRFHRRQCRFCFCRSGWCYRLGRSRRCC